MFSNFAIASMSTPAVPVSFSSLGLPRELTDVVTALGYEEPTPVQRETIPLLLEGRDLLGQAATGTGKTAAFALPMLQRISAGSPEPAPDRRASCSCPPASWRCRWPRRSTSTPKASGCRCCRSTAARRCTSRFASSSAARKSSSPRPGRALDHIRRGTLKLDALRVLILDEADEMLDMGFAEDLDAILKATPASRQTALFSATMPARILSIAERHLKNPARITIAREKAGDRQDAAGAAGRLHRQPRAEAGDARADPRHGGSGRHAGVLPDAAGSRVAGRNMQRARPPRRSAARRHDAEAARPRHGAVSRRRRRAC